MSTAQKVVDHIRTETTRYKDGLLPFVAHRLLSRLLRAIPETHELLTDFERGYFLGEAE